jgi:hypothetical protein
MAEDNNTSMNLTETDDLLDVPTRQITDYLTKYAKTQIPTLSNNLMMTEIPQLSPRLNSNLLNMPSYAQSS